MTFATRMVTLACAVLATQQTVSQAQTTTTAPRPGADSVVVKASRIYGASAFHSFMLGDNYRDLWGQPITVPVLNLGEYAGGLTALEEGGNAQTRNLHLRGKDGKEYVFRPIFKELVQMDGVLKGTVIADMINDGLSASHPAATVLPTAFLAAAGVLHPVPALYVMPDDSKLGEFRKDFAGKLGTMEEFPEDPKEGKGFAGAVDIIDSKDLLDRIDKDASTRIDAHALLKARLIDLLIGDNDRHPGQWKWARFQESDNALWVPIPRDRDKAFVSYEGAVLKLARLALPRLVTYNDVPEDASFYNSAEFDRRLLASLDQADFDSTARFLMRVTTDSVINAAIRSMPKEYQARTGEFVANIRARRDHLPKAAAIYYGRLFAFADLHGTDAADKATIVRQEDGSIDIRLEEGGVTYLDRNFKPGITKEIRLYLHDGSDSAIVRGNAPHSIPLWIVGGEGPNVLVDSSTVGGRRRPTRMYDNPGKPNANVVVRAGEVDLPKAEKKEKDKEKGDSATKGDEKDPAVKRLGYDPDTAWNRRPVMKLQGYELPPFRDQGSSVRPTLSFSTSRGIGIMPQISIQRRKFGFRQYPYASKQELEVGYATAVPGWDVEFTTDNRIESSRMFITTETGFSQVLTGHFGGFGNDVVHPADRDLTKLNQTQMSFHPAWGWAFGLGTEFTMGPVVKFTRTDSVPDQFIADARPYGFSRFGQAGFAVRFLHESDRQLVVHGGSADELLSREPRTGLTLDVNAAVYPGMWDATSTFGSVSAVATTFFTLPLPLGPIVAFRAGGQQNFGDYPYFEAAFLGGRPSVRTLRQHDFAGDAMIHGSAELRVPIAKFSFILPLNTGVFGFADAGRVYVDGESPGGWHSGNGVGLWLGVLKYSTNLSVAYTNQRDRRVIVGTGFIF